jgi:uncharacterized protein (TIGR03086 family)
MTNTTRMTNTVADPRPIVAKAIATTATAITAVRPDQMTDPTPCGTFNVRDLLGHLLGVLDRMAVVGRNVENPFARPETFVAPDDNWMKAWSEYAADVDAAWADPAALTRPTMLPWAAASGALALRTYAAELSAHTWDLAKATGQVPVWDDEVLRVSLDVMREILPAEGRREMFDAIKATMPEEMRGTPDPYEAAIPVAADAPLIDQLMAHVGRQP